MVFMQLLLSPVMTWRKLIWLKVLQSWPSKLEDMNMKSILCVGCICFVVLCFVPPSQVSCGFEIPYYREIEERNLDFELQCLQRQSFYQSSQDKSCSHRQRGILFLQSFYFWEVVVLGFKMTARKSKYDTDAGTNINSEELLEDLTSQLLVYFNHWFAENKQLDKV